MKLTSAVLLFAAAGPALAQTKTPTRPAVHHTAPTAARKPADACGADPMPVLPAAIPRITGCPKPLYALRYVDTVVGTGAAVTPRKWLTVAYTGYLTDGTKFDTSIGKEPITFPYGAHQVITGWDTGFEGMNIGGKRRLFIPFELAYGEAGRPPVIPAKAPLVFDIELIAISDTPPPPKPQPGQPAQPQQPANPAQGNPAAPGSAIPPTSAPQSTPPPNSPPNDPTKPTSIPPTTAPPATTPKPPAPTHI